MRNAGAWVLLLLLQEWNCWVVVEVRVKLQPTARMSTTWMRGRRKREEFKHTTHTLALPSRSHAVLADSFQGESWNVGRGLPALPIRFWIGYIGYDNMFPVKWTVSFPSLDLCVDIFFVTSDTRRLIWERSATNWIGFHQLLYPDVNFRQVRY